MDWTSIILAGMLCGTVLLGLSMYFQSSRMAVNQWKGRYLAVVKQAQREMQILQGEVSDTQFNDLFKLLNMDGKQGKKLLKYLKKQGIPEELILTLLNNPGAIKQAMGKVKDKLPQGNGESI